MRLYIRVNLCDIVKEWFEDNSIDFSCDENRSGLKIDNGDFYVVWTFRASLTDEQYTLFLLRFGNMVHDSTDEYITLI